MKKYYIYTFGCKVNRYETQLISEKLQKELNEQVFKPEDADIIIFNSCTVTAEADKECEYFLRKVSRLSHKPEIIITGCFAGNKASYIQENFPEISIYTDKTKLYLEPDKQTVKNFDKRSRAFLKIQDGCNSFCSYCIIPYIRNTLWSKPREAVIEEIGLLTEKGYSEIVFTGIHAGKYEGGIASLIKEVIKIPKEFRIRISSIELNEIDSGLIELMKENPDKICRHLHIPLQSGSDEILKKMDRKYFSADFEKKVLAIMDELPGLALTTDIITGFPGESGNNHKETREFVAKIPFSRFHIFRYSDRDGTKASEFKNKVPPEEIKRRSRELFETDKLKRKEFLQKNIGKKRKAVSTGKNKALTDNYITVKTGEKKNGIFDVTVSENSEV